MKEATENTTQQRIVKALQEQIPVKNLSGVKIRNVRRRPEQPFDISFDIRSASSQIQVLGEIKRSFSPRQLEEISPWIRRLKALRSDVAIAVIAPTLSSQAQEFCIENEIDFLDLAGNIFINVPGKLVLQRTGLRERALVAEEANGPSIMNVFSGKSSRVLRVLLENPRTWTVTGIAEELFREAKRVRLILPGFPVDLRISLGSISKTVASLEEQLWIRRRGTAVLVPEPSRLLRQWAERYKERYRWRLRSSFVVNNPYGAGITEINNGLQPRIKGPYAFTSAVAASTEAAFVDVDVIDVFLMNVKDGRPLRDLNSKSKIGPNLRFITPYDAGVFMYSKTTNEAPIVSSIQAFLDLYARGGRDLKQAEYLLSNLIERRWSVA